MRYAITLASFKSLEPMHETLPRLAKLGFDAVEVFGEPAEVDQKMQELLRSCPLPVCGVTGMWGRVSNESAKRRLLARDPHLASAAQEYVKACIRLCNSLGGQEFNVCLFADDDPEDRTHRITPASEKSKMAKRAVPILRELSKYAREHGVVLALEPLNRYSTPYCSTSTDAAEIVEAANSDSLGVLLDTFHMNIEEDSFAHAIERAGRRLVHAHLADNNRRMPGFAHIDFDTIFQTLKRIGYDRFLSFEPNIPETGYDADLSAGLAFARSRF